MRTLVALAVAGVALLVWLGYNAVPDRESSAVPTSINSAWKDAPSVPPPDECKGYVSLTFDDGPTRLTGDLLQVLEARDVPATFFNTGEQSLAHPEAVRAAHEAGHQFGNHSWDHSDLAKLDPQGVAEQLDRTSEVHEDLVGEPFEFFRPPYGSTSPAITQAAKDRGMREALWTVDSKDFQTESVEQVVAQASGMSDGGNVLLHDGHALTVEAVPYIINEYHERGLCFGKLGPSRQALSPAESPGLTYYVKAVAP